MKRTRTHQATTFCVIMCHPRAFLPRHQTEFFFQNWPQIPRDPRDPSRDPSPIYTTFFEKVSS